MLMQLTIDTDGQVLGAEIVESAGDAFDQAAIRTIERYQFTPALTKIINLSWFRFSIDLSSILEMLPPVNVRGRVQEAGLRDPFGECTDFGDQCSRSTGGGDHRRKRGV